MVLIHALLDDTLVLGADRAVCDSRSGTQAFDLPVLHLPRAKMPVEQDATARLRMEP
jgi:hypothetical protein